MILDSKTTSQGRRWCGLGAVALLAAWGTFVLTGSAEARVASLKDINTGRSEVVKDDVKPVVIVKRFGSADGEACGDVTVDVECLVDGKVKIIMNGEDVSGEHGKMLMLRTFGDVTAGGLHAEHLIKWISKEHAGDFVKDHPTADVDGDGKVSHVERQSYLVALAMSDPAAVLDEFPSIDRDENSRLDAAEVVRALPAPHAMWAIGALDVELEADAAHGVLQKRAPPIDGSVEKLHLEWIGEAEDESSEPHTFHVKIVTRNPGDAESKPESVALELEIEPVVVEMEVNPVVVELKLDGTHLPHRAMAFATNVFKSSPAIAHWLLENILVTPSVDDVARYIETVEQAPLARFLEMHPEADANGDGELSSDERTTFLKSMIHEMHGGETGVWLSEDGKGVMHHRIMSTLGEGGQKMHAFFRKLHGADEPAGEHVFLKTVIELKTDDGKLKRIVTIDKGDGEVVVEEVIEDDK